MRPIRFIMVGGFLGAGKTTTLMRLAEFFTAKGQKVGIITNDQADDLVDTGNLRSRGYLVEEVAGACFCCKFDDLIHRTESLNNANHPDVILAEPVGSCTDLVATVIQPLRDLYRRQLEVAPYAVLFKPSHGLKILAGQGSGFSSKADYIFRKQLEEADLIAVNRLDELSQEARSGLTESLAKDYPGTPVVFMSAKTGDGFDTLVAFLDQQGRFGEKILAIDYDTYAEGEAEMGWVNARTTLSGNTLFHLDGLILEITGQIGESLRHHQAEVAHLKVFAQSGPAVSVANLIGSDLSPDLSLDSDATSTSCDLIVNARVGIDPDLLLKEIEAATNSVAGQHGLTVGEWSSKSLRPGRPTPTHRYATVQENS